MGRKERAQAWLQAPVLSEHLNWVPSPIWASLLDTSSTWREAVSRLLNGLDEIPVCGHQFILPARLLPSLSTTASLFREIAVLFIPTRWFQWGPKGHITQTRPIRILVLDFPWSPKAMAPGEAIWETRNLMLRGLESREGADSTPRPQPSHHKVQPNGKPLPWFGYSKPVYPWAGVLVFQGGCDKLWQTWWIEITPLSVLEARNFESRCGQGHTPSSGSRRQSFLTSSRFWWLQGSLACGCKSPIFALVFT